MHMKNALSLFLLSATGAFAAQQETCEPTSPVCYTSDDCTKTYCLGPAKPVANAPVHPYTCNGDWEITVAGFYWKPHMDGLQLAIKTAVQLPEGPGITADIPSNNLVGAEFKNPHFSWDFGFRVGLGYNTTCDGWGIGLAWTRFTTSSDTLETNNIDDNQTLISLFGEFFLSATASVLDLKAHWSLDLDIVDATLGREYWVGPKLSFRPLIGLRYGSIEQEYDVANRGRTPNTQLILQRNYFSENNWDFRGFGILAGMASNWHFGCGYGLYGNLGISSLYGRFHYKQNGFQKSSTSPFDKVKRNEVTDSIRVSRAILDLGLGVEWFGLFCDCSYGLGVRLGWEQHLFFHQNPMWVPQQWVDFGSTNVSQVFELQRAGTLATGGWTLKVQFDF